MYKESMYNYYIESDDLTCIFNSYTGAIIKMDYDQLHNVRMGEFDKLSNDECLLLEKQGVLIEPDKNEFEIMKLSRIRQSLDETTVYYKILPTTECNARCFYCFEQGCIYCTMDDNTANHLMDFIEKSLNDKVKQVYIQWYGGEPLLGIELIRKLTKRMIHLFEEKQVKYSFSMITNGSMVTEDLAKEMSQNLHIRKVQITLDGLNEEYDKRKNYDSNSGNFKTVVNNIQLLISNNINVDIRLNCDGNNYDNIIMLIEYLRKRFINKKGLMVYPHPLYGCYRCSKADVEDVYYLDKKQLLTILTLLIKSGFLKIPSLFMKLSSCGATNHNSYVVYPDGRLLKCAMDDKHDVGNVFDGVKYNTTYFEWTSYDVPIQCKECKAFPICQGGCRAGHLGMSGEKCFVYVDLVEDIILMNIKKLDDNA